MIVPDERDILIDNRKSYFLLFRQTNGSQTNDRDALPGENTTYSLFLQGIYRIP